MSITDELRKWGYGFCGDTYDVVTAIADRIDAEHESAWVKLPVDADGVPIRIGDVMAYEDNTKPMEVVALVPPAVFLTEDGPRYADMCRHYHELTVEDVLREFTDAILDWAGKSGTVAEVGTWSDVAAEYAKRLMLAEREDA